MISVMVLTYNRDVLPCLKAIKENTHNKYELILVDNGNNYQESYKEYLDKYIGLKENQSVVSRNYGKLISKYDYIACIDDDVEVYPGWDEILLDTINEDSKIAGAGPCGAYVYHDLSNYNEYFGRPGNFVDVLTGYCWMHRNMPEGLLPFDYGLSTWHDETYVQFQMREKGYKFKMTNNVCSHDSQRGSEINWEDHNDKIEKIKQRFKIENLNLERPYY